MLTSEMFANADEWNVGKCWRVECWRMMASGMLANDGERMMASGMLANDGEWKVGE